MRSGGDKQSPPTTNVVRVFIAADATCVGGGAPVLELERPLLLQTKALLACADGAPKKHATLHLGLGGDQKLKSLRFEKSTLGKRSEKCVRQIAQKIVWPKFVGRKEVSIVYPLDLSTNQIRKLPSANIDLPAAMKSELSGFRLPTATVFADPEHMPPNPFVITLDLDKDRHKEIIAFVIDDTDPTHWKLVAWDAIKETLRELTTSAQLDGTVWQSMSSDGPACQCEPCVTLLSRDDLEYTFR